MVTPRDKIHLFQYKLEFTLALEQCKCGFFTKLTLFQELLD